MPSPSMFGLSGSNVNWEQMIEKVMKAYKKRLKIYKLNEWEIQQKLEVWKSLRKKLQEIRSSAKFLYDPINGPFNTLITEASDKKAFTASTKRNAKPGKYKIEVIQLATPDIYQSDPLKQTSTLGACKFTIKSGKKTFTINFSGGSPATLVSLIERIAGEIVSAQTTNIDGTKVVIVIRSKKTGVKNRLFFGGNTKVLEKIGLLVRRGETLLTEDFSNGTDFRTRKGTVHFKQNKLILTPNSVSERTIDNDVLVKTGFSLRFSVRLIPLDDSLQRAAQRLQRGQRGQRGRNGSSQNVRIGTIDRTRVGPYTIRGEHLQSQLTRQQREQQRNQNQQQQQTQQQQQQRTPFDNVTVILQLGSKVVKKISVQDNKNWKQYSISLNDIAGKKFDRIIFVNNNISRRIEFRKFVIDDGSQRLRAKHLVSKAQNAIIKYNGIRITRPTNNIKDLITGVTLTLNRRTNGPETLTVKHDYDKIVKAIKDLIIHYNNAMDYIYNVTKYKRLRNVRDRLAHMEKIKNMSDQEKQRLKLNGELYEGLLGGDSTVALIKRKLREVMMNPYPTSAGNLVKFFVQVGLQNPNFQASTNMSQEDRRNLRAGYFEFKKEKLLTALRENYDAVRQLFANDTDGDLVKDQGISIKLNQTIQYIAGNTYRAPNGRAYPGLITSRLTVTTNYLKSRKKQTARFEKQMERKRRRLIDQARRAEQAEARSRSIRSRLRSFNNTGSGR